MEMKRFLVLFMVVGLMAGAAATAEAKKKPKPKPEPEPIRLERTVEGSYGPYPAPATGCNEALGSWSCLTIPTSATEAFFTAKVTDAHGQPVFVEVGSSYSGTIARFCGETSEPIRFHRGDELHFYVALPVWGVQAVCPAHSIKTTGTISVTLSNLP
jgi:hypothetical protein